MKFFIAFFVASAAVVSAVPLSGRAVDAAGHIANGKAAQALNNKFKGLNANSPCTSGEFACIGDNFAQCANGKFVSFPCAGGLVCRALPLVNSAGTSVTCDTAADAATRISSALAGSG